MNATVKTSWRVLKSRGLRTSVPFLAPPLPASSIYIARPECAKALRTLTLAPANQANEDYQPENLAFVARVTFRCEVSNREGLEGVK